MLVEFLFVLLSHIAAVIMPIVDKKAVVAALPFAAAIPTGTLVSVDATAAGGAEPLTFPLYPSPPDMEDVKPVFHKVF